MHIFDYHRWFLLTLTGIVGILMTGWSLYMIFAYYRAQQKRRHQMRIAFRLSWLVLLIGIGDLTKVIRDFITLIKQMG